MVPTNRVARTLALVALLWVSSNLRAQPVIDGLLLGMPESQLMRQFPVLKRLHKPALGPHGLKGFWRIDNAPVAGFSLDTTFYTRSGQVARIEQLGKVSDAACTAAKVYAPLIRDFQARYGIGLASQDQQQDGSSRDSIVWAADGFDVLVHLSGARTPCSVTVIYQPFLGKDAATL